MTTLEELKAAIDELAERGGSPEAIAEDLVSLRDQIEEHLDELRAEGVDC